MAARLEKGCFEETILTYFLVCKGLSNDDVGVAGVAVFQEIRPGVGFETGDVVEERFGRATAVERLQRSPLLLLHQRKLPCIRMREYVDPLFSGSSWSSPSWGSGYYSIGRRCSSCCTLVKI